MHLFLLLFTKLIPLYASIAMGWFAGKRLGVTRDGVGVLVIYMLVPVVMFGGVVKADITPATLSLPLIGFVLATLLCGVFLCLARKMWDNNIPNILACSAGTGNTGYFGLPVAMLLFDEKTVAIYIILMLGVTVFESTIGMYVAAKGRYTAREALRKVRRIPTIYAFLLGVLVHGLGWELPEIFWDFYANVRGAYVILGMMIIGLGLASMPHFRLDWKFIAVAFSAKFIAWPLTALGFIWLDTHLFGLYSGPVYQSLLLISIVPMAANSVVIATLFDAHPEKAASAVLLSTLLALFYVPLIASFLFH